jgi:hypothetical protein
MPVQGECVVGTVCLGTFAVWNHVSPGRDNIILLFLSLTFICIFYNLFLPH